MGLFSAIGSFLGLGGNRKAISKAAQQANQALQQGINTIQGQQQANTQAYSPYTTAGGKATDSMSDLLGLNGPEAQSVALQQIKTNPLYTSQYDTGVNTVLQNASATGGLRGGNTENSLAQFGSGLYGDVYNQILGGLGGLSNEGLQATGAMTGANSQLSGSIAQMLGLQGQNSANATLGKQAANNSTVKSITDYLDAGNSGGGSNGGNLINLLSSIF